MPSLRIDPEQRFSCASCARCCTRPWEIVVTPAEVAAYRDRYPQDAFAPIARGSGFHRINKREDGACVFLTAANRCRIHEELGERHKPLTCRMFPFSFHPVGDVDVVRASFACPTIVANGGASTSDPKVMEGLKEVRTEWFRTYPRVSKTIVVKEMRRPIDDATLKILRTSFLQMLSRTNEAGQIDLRENVARIANSLDDLSRSAVGTLDNQRFAEYVALTAPFAAKSDKRPKFRKTSWNGRLMQRGFLFVTAATQLRVGPESHRSSKMSLRLKTLRLLAHFHGLGPGVGQFNLGLVGSAEIDLNGPELRPIAYNYLRAGIQTLGTGVRPIIDELAVAVSSLNAACCLAMMRAAKSGRPVDRATFSEALVDAVDVSHADYGLIARVLTFFAAGTEALHAFGNG